MKYFAAIISLFVGFNPPTTAFASFVPAPSLSNGRSLFVLNNVSGVVSFCSRQQGINSPTTCQSVSTFPNVSSATKLVADSLGAVYIIDANTGRTMFCSATLTGTIYVPTCSIASNSLR